MRGSAFIIDLETAFPTLSPSLRGGQRADRRQEERNGLTLRARVAPDRWRWCRVLSGWEAESQTRSQEAWETKSPGSRGEDCLRRSGNKADGERNVPPVWTCCGGSTRVSGHFLTGTQHTPWTALSKRLHAPDGRLPGRSGTSRAPQHQYQVCGLKKYNVRLLISK